MDGYAGLNRGYTGGMEDCRTCGRPYDEHVIVRPAGSTDELDERVLCPTSAVVDDDIRADESEGDHGHGDI